MKKKVAIFYAVLAALLYAINIPLSKYIAPHVGASMNAAFLYLGAGIGLFIYELLLKAFGKKDESQPLNKNDLPFVILMVVLDIAAPILLMFGLRLTTSANASLLNNFEIVATTVIALLIFKETVSKKLWTAIAIVTLAGVILTFEGAGSFTFNAGSFLVLGACVCWGFENNCTRKISNKSAVEIVVIKGTFSGLGSLIFALVTGESFPALKYIAFALALGFVAYGLSIKFYIGAQKELGAAKTSAYYSVAPFLGVAFGMILLGERPQLNFYIALAFMIVATVIMVIDTLSVQHEHIHTHIHTHAHSHGGLVHTHEHAHTHAHLHAHFEDKEEFHNHNHLTIKGHSHSH